MMEETISKDQIRGEVLEIILKALGDVKDEHGKPLANVSAETTLYGHGSDVDSFGFVQLLIDVEERVNERFSVSITPTDEKAMSQRNSPFRTASTLADYLADEVTKSRSQG